MVIAAVILRAGEPAAAVGAALGPARPGQRDSSQGAPRAPGGHSPRGPQAIPCGAPHTPAPGSRPGPARGGSGASTRPGRTLRRGCSEVRATPATRRPLPDPTAAVLTTTRGPTRRPWVGQFEEQRPPSPTVGRRHGPLPSQAEETQGRRSPRAWPLRTGVVSPGVSRASAPHPPEGTASPPCPLGNQVFPETKQPGRPGKPCLQRLRPLKSFAVRGCDQRRH